jgi:hypothetical protein
MKKTMTSAALIGLTVCASHAAIIWTGGGNTDNLFDAANYSGGAPVETGSGTDTPLGDDLLIANATIGNGAGYTIGFGELEAGAGDTVTLSNTTLDATGTTGGFAGTSPGDVNDLGAVFNITNNSFVNLQFIIHGTLNIDGTSAVRFRGGGNPINGTPADTNVNLTEAGARLILTNAANFSTNAGNGNKIFAANASGTLVSYNSDNSILTLVTAGGVTTGTANFSVVPEPSSALLAGLAVLGLVFRRRK